MLSDYQLKIADPYNTHIGNVKKLVPFQMKKNMSFIMIHLQARIKTEKIHRVLEFNQSHWLKQYVEFNTQKRIEAKKW